VATISALAVSMALPPPTATIASGPALAPEVVVDGAQFGDVGVGLDVVDHAGQPRAEQLLDTLQQAQRPRFGEGH
jgi:hypothetical protein